VVSQHEAQGFGYRRRAPDDHISADQAVFNAHGYIQDLVFSSTIECGPTYELTIRLPSPVMAGQGTVVSMISAPASITTSPRIGSPT